MLGVSYVMTFYVDACALVYFQFHPRSVGRSVSLSIPALRLGTLVPRQKKKLLSASTTHAHNYDCIIKEGGANNSQCKKVHKGAVKKASMLT